MLKLGRNVFNLTPFNERFASFANASREASKFDFTDIDAYRGATTAIGQGWRGRMGKHYPAMRLVKVAGLLEPGALVEIEGVAMLPG